MRKTAFLVSLIFGLALNAIGQNSKYIIYFKDKRTISFDPMAYFDSKAIERRIINNVSLVDSTDFPVNESYVTALVDYTDSIKVISRWLNAAFVYTDTERVTKISALWFVKEIQPLQPLTVVLVEDKTGDKSERNSFLLKKQTESFGSDYFFKNNIDGRGVRIAVFDAGFPNVDKHETFDMIRKENRILKTYDFVKGRENVYGHSSHGTTVLSCIAGKYNEQKIGVACGAEFLLARTEHGLIEPLSEEENWLAAAEWADKNGAQIISSSLGYTKDHHFKEDMNGKKSIVAQAALLAARKGILVVSAAGNDGTNEWKMISTPSDADSILTVGGIDPSTGYHTSFSSYGPTADKRLKPNVSAMGHVFAAKKEGYGETQGTSFSTPLTAGFAACVLQLNPTLTCQDLLSEIEKSATLYPFFDYAHGYGVPQASYFLNKNKSVNSTFVFSKVEQMLYIKIAPGNTDKENPAMDYLYYHVQKPEGYLKEYAVVKVLSENVLQIDLSDLPKKSIVRVHFKGYTSEYLHE